MKIKLDVSKIVVVTGYGTDVVTVSVMGFPNPIWPFDGNLELRFETAKGSGIEYVKKHFGIDPEVINIV